MSRDVLEGVLRKAHDTLRSGDLRSETAVRLAVIVPMHMLPHPAARSAY